jgi:hypothetical protein
LGVLEKLTAALPTFDFGIFVFSADDLVSLRNDTMRAVRDNVIFEMGLFVGNLGRHRTFFVVPRGTEDLRIPTDLAGVIPLSYDTHRQDGNMTLTLGPACNKIRRVLQELGPLNLRVTRAPQAQPAVGSTAGTAATRVRREEIITQLKALLDELKRVFAEATSNRPFVYAETKLTRWKARVTRFIGSNVSMQEAIAFAGIHTALGGAQDMQHLESSFGGHVSFLEALIEEIEADEAFPLKVQPSQSESELLVVKSFTYRKK